MSPHLLQHLLWERVQSKPDAVAVVYGSEILTYGELDTRSAMLANALVDEGIRHGDLVALHLRKSIDSIVAIYGILRSGAGYVPVDFSNPASRLADILDQCRIQCIVTEAMALGKLADERVRATLLRAAIVIDEPPARNETRLATTSLEDVFSAGPRQPPSPHLTDRDLAYVLFTSGSTGRPKGVMHTHQSALAFVNWADDTFGILPEDRLSNHAPLNFDLSVFDIFVAAKAGASVCLVPPALTAFPVGLAELIETQRISVWYSVPSVLARLASHGALHQRQLDHLRLVLFAGDVFPMKDLRMLMAALPGRRYYNLYGPTETNVCAFHEVESLPAPNEPPLPIGRACANSEVIVLAEDGSRIEESGKEGVLHVRGSIVMAGYLGRPEETEAAFVDSPSSEPRQDRFYCTGDHVKIDDHGLLRFIGRRDHMVKVGGHRVELGEVEAALNAHLDVIEAAAIALPDQLLGTRICAVVAVGEPRLDEQTLRQHCARMLPRYMIPAQFEFRRSLPHTTNDKIDRMRLLADMMAAVPEP